MNVLHLSLSVSLRLTPLVLRGCIIRGCLLPSLICVVKCEENKTFFYEIAQRSRSAVERLLASGQWVESRAIVAAVTTPPILQLSRNKRDHSPSPIPGRGGKARSKGRSPSTDRSQSPKRGSSSSCNHKDRMRHRSGSKWRDSS